MNEKVSVDLKSLKFILKKNKPYLFSSIIILICIILFLQFIIPQFGALLTAKEEGKEASLKLATLKENLNVLTNINEDSLDQQLKILTLALPSGKDFDGILNSISFASQTTGVVLGAFSLQIGDLADSKTNDKFPVVSLTVPIEGDQKAVGNFIETISKSVPLSKISSIKVGDRTSIVDISFYYKPLDGSTYKEDDRIVPISQKGLLLIDELTNFGNTSSLQ